MRYLQCRILGRMLRTLDIWDMGYPRCGILGMWDVWKWDVEDVGYWRCQMFKMLDVQVVIC